MDANPYRRYCRDQKLPLGTKIKKIKTQSLKYRTALVLTYSLMPLKYASGTFEAVETIVSAEVTGVIKSLNLEEGKELKAGEMVGHIDSMQLYLKKKQLEAQVAAVLGKKPDVSTQVAAHREQLKQAVREQQRISNLLMADAATAKQLDD